MKYKTVGIINSDKTQQSIKMKNFVQRRTEKHESHLTIFVSITSENKLKVFSHGERHR
jgi:hypothetical protein